MTAFAIADLPASINTVEKLAAWSSTLLNHLNPTLTVIEAAGIAERAITAAPFYITADPQPKWRYISRSSLVLNPNWQRGGKIWENALELSTTAIPPEFKS